MEKIDYKKLSFKCGLELHVSLESHKLFCNCPSIIDNSEPEIRIRRKLRAVAGAKGKKDIAALYEETKDKEFIYEYSSNYACLICLDEEPPLLVNEKALTIALEIALLLNAKIKPKLKILRKNIIDGSNIGGFQRLTLIATNGSVKTSRGKVRISTIYLEEDAARKMKEEDNVITYRLDRAGSPLVEISTAPDIEDPEDAKETASLLGMILKSTGKIKAGIGSIRQDLNVSIKGHPRVELKGFQDLRKMPIVIENEVSRQLSLIKEKKKTKKEVRKVNEDTTTTFLRPLPGEARIYIETDEPEVTITKDMLKKIKLPELISEKTLKLEKKLNISLDLAKEIIKSKINLEDYTKKYLKLEPKLIATILIETPKELKTRFKVKEVKQHYLEFILDNLNKGKINKEAIIDILLDLTENKKVNLLKYKKVSSTDLNKDIEKVISENQGASLNALMGILMKKFKGKVDASKLASLLKERIK